MVFLIQILVLVQSYHKSGVAEPKLLIFGSGSTFVPYLGCSSTFVPYFGFSSTFVPYIGCSSTFVPYFGCSSTFVPYIGCSSTFVPYFGFSSTFVPYFGSDSTFVPYIGSSSCHILPLKTVLVPTGPTITVVPQKIPVCLNGQLKFFFKLASSKLTAVNIY